eukprot:3583657-Amphidinium_carterae.1
MVHTIVNKYMRGNPTETVALYRALLESARQGGVDHAAHIPLPSHWRKNSPLALHEHVGGITWLSTEVVSALIGYSHCDVACAREIGAAHPRVRAGIRQYGETTKDPALVGDLSILASKVKHSAIPKHRAKASILFYQQANRALHGYWMLKRQQPLRLAPGQRRALVDLTAMLNLDATLRPRLPAARKMVDAWVKTIVTATSLVLAVPRFKQGAPKAKHTGKGELRARSRSARACEETVEHKIFTGHTQETAETTFVVVKLSQGRPRTFCISMPATWSTLHQMVRAEWKIGPDTFELYSED